MASVTGFFSSSVSNMWCETMGMIWYWNTLDSLWHLGCFFHRNGNDKLLELSFPNEVLQYM